MKRLTYDQLREALQNTEESADKGQVSQICTGLKYILEEKKKRRRIGFPAFLKLQLRFICWKIWLVQGVALVLLCGIFAGIFENPLDVFLAENVRLTAFFLCCLSILVLLCAVPMIYRSVRYKMHEIESSVYYSAVKLLIAKLLAIGIGNVAALSILLLLTIAKASLQIESALLYLILPYLAACSGFLYLLGHIPAEQFQAGSIGWGCFLLLVLVLLKRFYPDFFAQTFTAGWAAVCLMLLLLCVHQFRYLLAESAYAGI